MCFNSSTRCTRESGEKFFGQRVYGLIQDSAGGEDSELDPELKAVTGMGLSEFDTYIEMLVATRGNFHRQYITECFDSLLLKNRSGAMIAQGRTKSGPRRFILDSRLLEVLLQIGVLQPGGTLGYYTGELRIDELLTFLRERYGSASPSSREATALACQRSKTDRHFVTT